MTNIYNIREMQDLLINHDERERERVVTTSIIVIKNIFVVFSAGKVIISLDMWS